MTTLPTRIQRKRIKGWRMPENTIFVGRPTIFGNPFTSDDSARAVEAYKVHVGLARQYDGMKVTRVDPHEPLVYEPMLEAKIRELRGKNLACWCPLDQPCHADVLLELANVAEKE